MLLRNFRDAYTMTEDQVTASPMAEQPAPPVTTRQVDNCNAAPMSPSMPSDSPAKLKPSEFHNHLPESLIGYTTQQPLTSGMPFITFARHINQTLAMHLPTPYPLRAFSSSAF